MMNADHLGADDFVDRDLNPKEVTMTIKDVKEGKTPAGNKSKPEIVFMETPKTAFLANTQFKAIAHFLRRGNTDDWKGAKVTITSRETTMKGQPTTGMKVVKAWFDKPQTGAPNAPQV